MEKELTIKIDLEKLTQDVLEKETYSEGYTGYAIIQNRVKDEIKNLIRENVLSEIKKNLNFEELKEQGYSKEYLKLEANNIITNELQTLVKTKTEEWVKQNIRWVIEKQAEKSIEEFLVPRLQKMINNLMVVNTEAVENEMQSLIDDYENQIKDVEGSL